MMNSQQQGLTTLNPNAFTGNAGYYGNNNNQQQQQGYYQYQQQQGYYNNQQPSSHHQHRSFTASSSMSSSAMNLSPIMMQCGGGSSQQPQPQQQAVVNNNTNDSSMDSNTNTDATHKTASSGSHSQRVQGQALVPPARKRKYTHNPYASSNASSRASSTCSTENSAPSTPMSNSFSSMPPQNVAAAGGAMMMMSNNNTNNVTSNMVAGGYPSVSSSHQHNNNNQQQQQQFNQGMMMMMQQQISSNNNNNISSSSSGSTNSGDYMNMNMFNNNNNTGYALPQQQHNMNRRSSNPNMNMNMNMNSNNNYQQMQQQQQQGNTNDVLMFPGGSVHSLKSATEQFESMRGQIVANSCNQRGRHVVVAMIRLQQPEYNDIIFEELSAGWGALISDMNGCHVARTFVETVSSEQIQKLCESMSRDVVLHMCSASQYSRRVLQTMFENHSSEPYLQSIVDKVATGAVALATTQQGCISVMRILEFSKPQQRDKLMAVLSPHLAALAADPYGNYVLQTITQSLGTNEMVCATLEKAFEGSWVALSCNKFASNVMEKIIRIAAETPSSTVRKTIIEELVSNTGNLSIIIVDGFGNFVLQAIIDSCNNVNEFKKIGDRIRPLLASSPYGHKIEGKLKSKRFGGGSGSNSNSRSGSEEAF